MTPRQRIETIKLIEKLERNPEFSKKLNIKDISEFKTKRRQNNE